MTEEDRRKAERDRRVLLRSTRVGSAGRRADDPKQVLRNADAELERAERMLKIAQVARMANVSERTVWRDIRAGKLLVRYPAPKRPRVPVESARTYAGLG